MVFLLGSAKYFIAVVYCKLKSRPKGRHFYCGGWIRAHNIIVEMKNVMWCGLRGGGKSKLNVAQRMT